MIPNSDKAIDDDIEFGVALQLNLRCNKPDLSLSIDENKKTPARVCGGEGHVCGLCVCVGDIAAALFRLELEGKTR